MEMQIFENRDFGRVRTLLDADGQILFCGSDVAKALGYVNTRKALIDHCKGVTKRDTLAGGGSQRLSFIPEPDVYRLIFRSKLPTAEQFEVWVVETVLPILRRHGAYITPEILSKMEDSPEFTSQLIRMLRQEQDKSSQMQEQMEAVSVKSEYFDRFMETDTLTNIRNTAKELRIPEKLFTHLLVEMGFVYRYNNQLWPYAFMVHYRYAALKDYVAGKHGGVYMLFTPLGKLYLQKRIAQRLAMKSPEAAKQTDQIR